LKSIESCVVLLCGLVCAFAVTPDASATLGQNGVEKTPNCAELIKQPLPQFKVQRSFRGDLKPMLFVFLGMKGEDINQDTFLSLVRV
jgi:hypothetical protein